MPSKTKAQAHLMAAVAHNPAFAKKVGIPQSVGKEFNQADKGRKFAKGGDMKESKAMMKKEIGFMKKAGAPKSMVKHEMAEAGMKKGGKACGYAKGGVATSLKEHAALPASKAHAGMKGGGYVRAADGIAQKGKTKGRMV